MKISVHFTRLAGRVEIDVNVQRTSAAESARFAAEDSARYRAAMESIRAAPESAAEIVAGVLGE